MKLTRKKPKDTKATNLSLNRALVVQAVALANDNNESLSALVTRLLEAELGVSQPKVDGNWALGIKADGTHEKFEESAAGNAPARLSIPTAVKRAKKA